MRSSVALPPIKRAQLLKLCKARYASSNKETPALLRTMQPKHESILNKLDAYRSVFAQLILDARIEVIAVYALNYLKLQVLKLTYRFLSANIIALIGIVLYNAIKEYYNNRIRKTIYFYSYTIEKDNILTIDKCRTSYSNKKDIEADKREKETRVRLCKLLREIYNILLREFRRANDFIESIIHNDNEQELELEDYNALVERYKEEINCSNLYSTM
ncbi:hypothetical protein HBI69_242220 [Parastagonospora nodorum]|nr:hypothetical protein HBI69_242220 [Parastagonospora nodorum]